MKELEDFLDASQLASSKIMPMATHPVINAWNKFMSTVPALILAINELEALYKAEMKAKHESKS